ASSGPTRGGPQVLPRPPGGLPVGGPSVPTPPRRPGRAAPRGAQAGARARRYRGARGGGGRVAWVGRWAGAGSGTGGEGGVGGRWRRGGRPHPLGAGGGVSRRFRFHGR